MSTYNVGIKIHQSIQKFDNSTSFNYLWATTPMNGYINVHFLYHHVYHTTSSSRTMYITVGGTDLSLYGRYMLKTTTSGQTGISITFEPNAFSSGGSAAVANEAGVLVFGPGEIRTIITGSAASSGAQSMSAVIFANTI